MTPFIHNLIVAMGIGRIALGIAPFIAAGLSSRLLGFPHEHDTATTRLMARFFGVRDIGLGVLAFYGLAQPVALSFIMLFNAATDGGDLFAIALPLIKRAGIDRAAVISALFATTGGVGWLVVWVISR